MSWLLDYKKYRKKVKELLFARSELEYQDMILSDANHDFEEYYLRYCAEKNIDLSSLKSGKEQKIDNIFSTTEAKKEALIHKPVEKAKDKTKAFNGIYKEIAKRIHPDKLSIFLPVDELNAKESMFKTASAAMKDCDWGKLLEVADKLDIKPKTFDGMIEQMDMEITKINKIVNHNNTTYSWVWYNCESEECKDEVIKQFLHHLFDYRA